MDRKAFIIRAGRYGALAALLFLVGFMLFRRSVQPGGECSPEFCGDCNLKKSCKSYADLQQQKSGRQSEIGE